LLILEQIGLALGQYPQMETCTLKALVEHVGEQARIVTIGRSEPCHRPPELVGEGKAHLVENNTVFCALCGKRDQYVSWQPYSYFACNNLTKHADRFACDRIDWATWYKSTLALPLRFRDPDNNDLHKILGFLTFDMPTTGEFAGVPDIYDVGDFHKYQELSGASVIINVAGAMADTLTVLLRPVLDKG